jgi:nucleoside-diphosphate-sugar epimerase
MAATYEDIQINPNSLSNYGFSKYIAELLVKKYEKEWLILRLGGMVGDNMKKNATYDILHLKKLFISGKSKLQFINTEDVAIISKRLVEAGKWRETYNIVGEGNIELKEIARLAGIKLSSQGDEIKLYNVSHEKLSRFTKVPKTEDTIRHFILKELMRMDTS